jgi:UDP-2,4-diacetamido-2,4,6-trideoxy-beta-L-altropyranose hydrolase
MTGRPAPRILFAPDSGALAGGGHVMRCLTLAGAMQQRGWTCAMLAGEAGLRLAAAFGPPGVEAIALADETPDGCAAAFAELGGRFDIVAVDNYRLDAAQEARVDRAGVVAIDDLADRAHRCRLLIDTSFGRRPDAYAGLVPPEAAIFSGVAYALLRPAFAAARPAAAIRRDGRPMRRALVSLGLTDLGGVTARVVDALAEVMGEAALDVVVGAGAPSLPRLRALAEADARLRLHVDTPDMARLMTEADIAVGAGGSTTWERACLGLPSVTVVLADNQRSQARALDAQGLTLTVEAGATGFAGDLAEAWRRLSGDAGLRRRMAQRTMEVCDGRGAERVAGAIVALVGNQVPESSVGS